MLNLDRLRNPVYRPVFGVRDPSVLVAPEGLRLFYTHWHDGPWGESDTWSVDTAFTRDFRTFEDPHPITARGYGSPGDAVLWHGRYVLAYQIYPRGARLVFSESPDGATWSPPRLFLEEALKLPWNAFERCIDPTFVVDGDRLHCFFVGSCARTGGTGHANLLGHAVTTDPDLAHWDILTPDRPLLGLETLEEGGVENVAVFRCGGRWRMIYSEGLDRQRLASAVSDDLLNWRTLGAVSLPAQRWMSRACGAPFVWRDGSRFLMLLMGIDDAGHASFGLLHSGDSIVWTPVPQS